MVRPELRWHFVFACTVLILVVVTCSAQPGSEKVTAAIHAGRLIDVRSGRVTTNGYITIAKGRIAGIGIRSRGGSGRRSVEIYRGAWAYRLSRPCVGESEGSIFCLGFANVIAPKGHLGSTQPADLA